MSTVYEWIVEQLEDGDIVDVYYFTNYNDAKSFASVGGNIALHKAVSGRNGDEEELDVSAYAYIEKGVLPNEFDNGDTIPKRFYKEIPQI